MRLEKEREACGTRRALRPGGGATDWCTGNGGEAGKDASGKRDRCGAGRRYLAAGGSDICRLS